MQTITNTKTVVEKKFIADDGTVFLDERDCKEYEATAWVTKNALDEDQVCFDVNKESLPELMENLRITNGGFTWASAELNDIGNEKVRCILQYDQVEEDWTLRPLSALITEAQMALDDLKEYEKL